MGGRPCLSGRARVQLSLMRSGMQLTFARSGESTPATIEMLAAAFSSTDPPSSTAAEGGCAEVWECGWSETAAW